VNSPFYAWALPLLPDASMVDGILDVAVFPRMGRLALIGSLVSVMRMHRLPQRPVRYKGARIAIESAAPLAIHADGTLAGVLPSEFRCRAPRVRLTFQQLRYRAQVLHERRALGVARLRRRAQDRRRMHGRDDARR